MGITFAAVQASLLLRKFCLQVRCLYGERYQTYNVHNLLHIVKRVFDGGPLWANDTFWYEDFNSDLWNLFHETQNVDLQVITAVSVQQEIPQTLSLLPEGTRAHNLFKRMSLSYHHRVQSKTRECISDDSMAAGTMHLFQVSGPISKCS